ncbi:MAG: O-antigen ligase family protein [Fusobacterium sp.]
MNRNKIVENLGLLGICIYGVSTVVSKAGINIGMGIMLLSSLFFIKKFSLKKLNKELKYLLILILLIPVFDLLSPGGIKSSLISIEKSYRFFPVFLIPIFINDLKKLKYFMYSIGLSILINCSYGIYLQNKYNWKINRYYSFTDVMNSAHCLTALSFIVLALVFISYKEKKKINLVIFTGIYFLNLFCILLGKTRGSWLAFIGAIIMCIIIFLHWKKSLTILIGFALGLIFVLNSEYFSNNKYINRIKSIENVKAASPKIRLLMWEAGKDIYIENPIFGVGKDNGSKYYLKKLDENNSYERLGKGKASLRKIGSSANPHNMYVDNFVNMGSLAFLWLGYLGYILIEQIKYILKNKKTEKYFYLMANLGITISFYITGLTESAWNNLWKRNVFLIGVAIFVSLKKIEDRLSEK